MRPLTLTVLLLGVLLTGCPSQQDSIVGTWTSKGSIFEFKADGTYALDVGKEEGATPDQIMAAIQANAGATFTWEAMDGFYVLRQKYPDYEFEEYVRMEDNALIPCDEGGGSINAGYTYQRQ